MPERGRLVRPVLPIEEAHRKEANPFGYGLEVGGRAVRAPAGPTFFWPLTLEMAGRVLLKAHSHSRLIGLTKKIAPRSGLDDEQFVPARGGAAGELFALHLPRAFPDAFGG